LVTLWGAVTPPSSLTSSSKVTSNRVMGTAVISPSPRIPSPVSATELTRETWGGVVSAEVVPKVKSSPKTYRNCPILPSVSWTRNEAKPAVSITPKNCILPAPTRPSPIGVPPFRIMARFGPALPVKKPPTP